MNTTKILTFIRPIFRNYVYVMQRGIAKGLKRRGGLGFIPSNQLSLEHRFLMNLDFKDKKVFDIGGWEGIFTLFFAQSVGEKGHVFTFEPNSLNANTIRENLKLNQLENRVSLYPYAVGSASGNAQLIVDQRVSGMGRVIASPIKAMDNNSTNGLVDVSVFSIDNLIEQNKVPVPNFVKIDVEGFEYEVLQGMIETINLSKPKLFIEIHAYDADNPLRVTQLLEKLKYTMVHVETGKRITVTEAKDLAWEHLFCE